MDELKTTIFLEMPAGIQQQEIWDVEDQLKLVEGIETNLLEPKDMITSITLMLQIITATTGTIVAVAGGAKTVYEAAKILYDFLHHSDKKQQENEAKKKIVIIKKGKRFELYNLSIEDIEGIIKEQ